MVSSAAPASMYVNLKVMIQMWAVMSVLKFEGTYRVHVLIVV